jgi:aminoglycoside phosphotransferase (APT) family kinase protein
MQHLPGIAAGHRLTREADLVPDPDALAHALGANLAQIHAMGPGVAGLDALPPAPRDAARRAVDEYRAYLDRCEDAYPALECGLRWCEVHAPEPRAATLVHRDYRTGNYLVDGGRLSGVLDWEFAGFGDPREDLGWFTARCWRFAAPEREAGGIAALDPFLDGYASIAGWRISRAELDYWQLMAHLRWAIIALQQAHRHRAGGERSLELALTGRIVHELEYEALQILSRCES